MRGLPVRRLASAALCATLVLAVAGPAAAAADSGPAQERVQAESRAPVPGADAVLAQAKSLDGLGGVIDPVTELLQDVLQADNGQLPAAEATEHADAVKEAIAKITAAAPATPATPATPSTANLPGTTTQPAASAPTSALPALPALTRSDGRAPAADLKDDALAALQKAVDALLKEATSGNVGGVLAAATGVVTGLVNLLAATLLSGGLPAPNLAGLPALPSLPASPPAVGGLLPTS
ncbi:hypothetical protein [Streptomyces sp. enrichment culture]|uniref:hypothetical protein n=1 Tax=Streptomyces sp. enrichment culture TaxID=1795815 RepID=UPI003F548427